jgi:hypothetical protein
MKQRLSFPRCKISCLETTLWRAATNVVTAVEGLSGQDFALMAPHRDLASVPDTLTSRLLWPSLQDE